MKSFGAPSQQVAAQCRRLQARASERGTERRRLEACSPQFAVRSSQLAARSSQLAGRGQGQKVARKWRQCPSDVCGASPTGRSRARRRRHANGASGEQIAAGTPTWRQWPSERANRPARRARRDRSASPAGEKQTNKQTDKRTDRQAGGRADEHAPGVIGGNLELPFSLSFSRLRWSLLGLAPNDR